MAPSSRDRLTVDLRGLKAAIWARAEALGVSPSSLVRLTLFEVLGSKPQAVVDQVRPARRRGEGDRVRLTLRMNRDLARATMLAARRAGLSAGDYVAGLVSGVPVLSACGSRIDCIHALTTSSAELATLSRNVHRLTALLRMANVEAARPLRKTLDTLDADVRRHLELAAAALAELRPQLNAAPATWRVPQ